VRWALSDRADVRALPLADRHYNRQKPGTPQFVPPGSCLVLLTEDAKALWVTSWPFAEYTKHAWAGAWINSCFRNEAPGEYLSSDLIREAVAGIRALWGDPPSLGMVTFIDTKKTRRKRDPGRCYRKAGFKPAICPKHEGQYGPFLQGPGRICCACRSETEGGLVALQLRRQDFPAAVHPIGAQLVLSA
jgi:hypothetical protein